MVITTLGPDGQIMSSYQKSRNFLERDIISALHFFHETEILTRGWTAIFTALVLKNKVQG